MTNIIRLTTIHSTNDYLIAETSLKTLPELTFVIAEEQSKGRGFADNTWESAKGLNLTISGLFYPTFIDASNLYLFNMCIALAVCDTVECFIDAKHKVSIKWPNDIYVDSNKIAGILIEGSFSNNKLDFFVAGIGLNVNQMTFVSHAPNPISLKQIIRQSINIDVCLTTLLKSIQERYAQLKDLAFESILISYHNKLYQRGRLATYKYKGGKFIGTIKKVQSDGKLVVEDQQKNELIFNFKEIEFC